MAIGTDLQIVCSPNKCNKNPTIIIIVIIIIIMYGVYSYE
jgi:hypothetical protein